MPDFDHPAYLLQVLHSFGVLARTGSTPWPGST